MKTNTVTVYMRTRAACSRLNTPSFMIIHLHFSVNPIYLSNICVDNSALIGGVIKASSSYIELILTQFKYNLASSAGVMQLDNSAILKA